MDRKGQARGLPLQFNLQGETISWGEIVFFEGYLRFFVFYFYFSRSFRIRSISDFFLFCWARPTVGWTQAHRLNSRYLSLPRLVKRKAADCASREFLARKLLPYILGRDRQRNSVKMQNRMGNWF